MRSYLIALLALFTAYARVEKADDSVDNKDPKHRRLATAMPGEYSKCGCQEEETNGLEPAWRVLIPNVSIPTKL